MVFFFGMIKDRDVNDNVKVKVNVNVLGARVRLPDLMENILRRLFDACFSLSGQRFPLISVPAIVVTAYIGVGNGVANCVPNCVAKCVADHMVSCEKSNLVWRESV